MNRDRNAQRDRPRPPEQRGPHEGDGTSDDGDEPSRKFLQERPWQLCHILTRLLRGEKLAVVARLEPPVEYYQFLPGVKTPGGRTENFVFSGWVGAYAWSGLWGSSAEAEKWHGLVVDYLERQRTVGHMGGEQCCPDPHHGMHLGAVGVARLAAHYFGHRDVLDLCGVYYSDHLTLGKACADATGEVRAPGLRNKHRPPKQQLWSWYVREMTGARHRPDLAQKDDPYFTGAIAARALRDGWPGGAKDYLAIDLGVNNCVLRYPMTVERTDRGYLACMDTGGKPVMQGVYWVCVDGGEASYGYDINDEPPAPPGDVVKVIRFGKAAQAGSSEL